MPHRPLSMLSHVELLTPKLDESVAFARDMLGMFVVAEEGDSVYLRCWGDYYATASSSPKAPEPGLGHVAFRTLERRAARHRGRLGRGVRDHGPVDRVVIRPRPRLPLRRSRRPPTELFWEVDRAVAPAGEESPYPERPQRTAGHGIPVRLLDHVTVTTPDVKSTMYWHRDVLDMRLMAAVEEAPGAPWFFGIATNNEKSHDLGFILDFDGIPGRLHHAAFWVETNHDLTEGTKFLIERGCQVDYGPGQHGIGEQNYLYFRDPAGLRYELNSGGYRNYVPDWEPQIWRFEDGPNNTFRTEIGMPAVHMVAIPPGIVGESAEQFGGIVAKG